MTENRREFYRILYPLDEQPAFHAGGTRYRVRDCSERGLSFVRHARDVYEKGDAVAGKIEFASGETVEVAGRVVRAFEDVVALELTDKVVPFGLILAEQRRLHAQRRLAF